MPRQRRVIIIAKQRSFDAATWQQLLSAFAYVLHEQRQRRDATEVDTLPATKDQS